MLEKIKEFQQAGGHTVAYSTDNHIPSIEDRKLRLKIILEELEEKAESYGLRKYFIELKDKQSEETELLGNTVDTLIFDRKSALDADCDLLVTVNGGFCVDGFTDIAQEAYDETMRSNMSKFCYSLDEALATVAGKDDWTYRVTNINGRDVYVFLRKSDGKILKGKGFFQPDYSKLLEKGL